MQEQLAKKVTYTEHPTRQLLKNIRSEGYFLADCNGVAVENYFNDMWSIGILTPYRRKEKERGGFLGGLLTFLSDISCEQGDESWRRPRIGQLYLRNDYHCTRDHPSKHWTLEVYGTNNVDRMKSLAVKLTEKHGVPIDVKLDRSWELKESEPEDFGD